jgi:transcription termination/antitermination protein NusA
VSDELMKVEGVTTQMMIAFGEHKIKTLEDLADCATDDLMGYTERKKDAEPVRHEGVLKGFDVDKQGAENLIMQARVLLGWIKAEDLVPVDETEGDELQDGEHDAAPAATKP